jgi:hypothetical protein
VYSVHDSEVAYNWLQRHCNHEFLEHLRKSNIGGPVASMLSVDAPALTIFAPMSSQTIKLGDGLAQLSGFPVMIRPKAEDPSAYFRYVDWLSGSHGRISDDSQASWII